MPLYFSVAQNEVGPDGASILAEALHVNSSLTELNLSLNLLEKDGAVALSKALQVNSSLDSIGLSNNGLCGLDYFGRGSRDPAGIQAIAAALNVNASLRCIDLSRNRLEKESALALARALEVNASMTSMDVSCNELCGPSDARDMTGIKAIADALRVSNSMTKLE